MSEQEESQKYDDKLQVRLDEDFASLYANNVAFESSVWDLRILFGELDQSEQPTVVERHTAMNLAWPTAKIAAYFLTLNVLIHESNLGPIKLRNDVIPKPPNPDAPNLDPRERVVLKYLRWVHEQFFGANPYVPPEVAEEMEKQKQQSG